MKKEIKCKHQFNYIGGGCELGEKYYPCDDEFECKKCGEKIKIICSQKIHFERDLRDYIKKYIPPNSL